MHGPKPKLYVVPMDLIFVQAADLKSPARFYQTGRHADEMTIFQVVLNVFIKSKTFYDSVEPTALPADQFAIQSDMVIVVNVAARAETSNDLEGSFQVVWIPDIIRIEERKPFAFGSPDADISRSRATPSRRFQYS
jgi:hypothetical protein